MSKLKMADERSSEAKSAHNLPEGSSQATSNEVPPKDLLSQVVHLMRNQEEWSSKTFQTDQTHEQAVSEGIKT